ncbi:PPAN [Bugula neritina]|uniref:PPAN n=1 Tax=Bugula neritina TaxID=10212 RepID=A0A7J7J0A3_BUGNE|nr:PPAN [Bugula neritina]
MRKVMSPFTAEHLKVHRRNVMKDFVAMSGPLGVSHMIMFTKSDTSVNLRVCRLPRGPTLTFQVKSYSTIADLSHHIRRHDVNDNHFKYHALLVMNNFSKEIKHQKLTASMFQNMFPSININKVIHLRVVPLGVSRSVKKLQKKNVPKLSKYNDISQFLLNPGVLSESEAELDGEHNSVELPQKMTGTGNTQNDQSAIRLKEIGPRMTLSLTKITDGVCGGDVLYHKFDTLTDEQKAEIVKKREQRKKLKAERTAQQNERVKLKKQAKLAHKERSQQGQKDSVKTQDEGESDGDSYKSVDDSLSDDMDDADYFEQEVGKKPEHGLFSSQARKAKKRPHPAKSVQVSDKKLSKRPKLVKSKSAAHSKLKTKPSQPFSGGARNQNTKTNLMKKRK